MSPDAFAPCFLASAFAGRRACHRISGHWCSAPAGFGLLQRASRQSTFAAFRFLVFAAPFIIMRKHAGVRAGIERPRFQIVMMATDGVAGFCFWTLYRPVGGT